MATAFEDRVERLERSNRRYRRGLAALGVVLAGALMAGQVSRNRATNVEGFTAVMDQAGGMSYFRLLNTGYVEVLDTTRADRWFWRRIRNWPE